MTDYRIGRDGAAVVTVKPGWIYPAAGHPRPAGGAKVLLLTIGGVAALGPWTDDGRYIAWAPLPSRNHQLETETGIAS